MYVNQIPRVATCTFKYGILYYVARYWEVVERLKINHFYTTPSMIRKLMSLDKDIPNSFDLSSLRVIASGKQHTPINGSHASDFLTIIVGECLNKEAWMWFHKRFGNCRCHFIDTWWQTGMYHHLLIMGRVL